MKSNKNSWQIPLKDFSSIFDVIERFENKVENYIQNWFRYLKNQLKRNKLRSHNTLKYRFKSNIIKIHAYFFNTNKIKWGINICKDISFSKICSVI